MDVYADTTKHINEVARMMRDTAWKVVERSKSHDASKFESPEREMYEVWRPKLDALDIQSDEYKQTLAQMGEGLKHHYAANQHHPEHFENGIAGMNLVDLLEMICDWKAAAARKNEPVNMKWASDRFGIQPDSLLYHVIENTIADIA